MSNNDFLEKIRGANENYKGKIKSVTFVVKREGEKKKIFKWFFKPGNLDFYVSFPYFQSENYHCGIVETPDFPQKGTFNPVENGTASTIPLKFSYHRDGNIHFKPTNYNIDTENKAYKLASLKAAPITEREGEHLFTILFEGLAKFEDYPQSTKRKREGELEVVLEVPKDIINFEIRGYASSTPKGLDGKIKKDVPPWFQFEAISPEGLQVYMGIYAIISRKSHIVDSNKNGLVSLVGFDRSQVKETGNVKSLYLFAR